MGFLSAAGARAVTVEQIGAGPAEVTTINCTGVGTIIAEAGILKINVDGALMDAFCIDPLHLSDGSMPGYQVVPLTSAPKGNFMSATTALEIRRLWGSFYSPAMSDANAAGLQIAIWELTGGTGFKLLSGNDYGAAGFLNAVQDPNYSGPVADLVGLTGSGQDYGILNSVTVPDAGSTLGLLTLSLFGLAGISYQIPRFAPARVRVLRASKRR
jgi:hypothetical protein